MGFLRKIFGRDVDTSTFTAAGRVLTVDTSADSGVKWASPLPTPASTGQVIKSTGNTEGAFAWGADFDLPAPASVGQVLTATGTGVGDYAWAGVSSKYVSTTVGNYSGTVSPTLTVPSGCIRIIMVAPGGGGAGGGGANSGFSVASNGAGGTGGGSGTTVILTYVDPSVTSLSVGVSIAVPGTAGTAGTGGGGIGAGQVGGNGGDGGLVGVTINGVTFTAYGGKGGIGGSGNSGGANSGVAGSGVPTVLITENVYSGSMPLGRTLVFGSAYVTVEYLANVTSVASATPNTGPYINLPSPGTDGGGILGTGFSYSAVGGIGGTSDVDDGHPGQDGNYDAHSFGFGGGGGGGGNSGAGGTHGGAGGKGGVGMVTVIGY